MTKYKKQFIDEIVAWVTENGLIDYGGATLMELCDHFHIDNVTYYNWMGKSEFSERIKNAKAIFKSNLQRKLETSLAKSATGYEWEETQTELIPDENGNPTIRKQVKTNRHVASNVAAGIFILTNIAPDTWQNKQRADVSISREEKPRTREEVLKDLQRLRELRQLAEADEADDK